MRRLGPFWFPDMFTNVGLYGSAGLMVGLLVVFRSEERRVGKECA